MVRIRSMIVLTILTMLLGIGITWAAIYYAENPDIFSTPFSDTVKN